MEGVLQMGKLPEVKQIEINRWYVCLIGASEELCKVKLFRDPIANTSYQVVCYYTGKVLIAGNLKECQTFVRDHILLRR